MFNTARPHNSTSYVKQFAKVPKGGVSCFADTFVVAESSVLRMNIRAEKPAHRKSANRYNLTTVQTSTDDKK